MQELVKLVNGVVHVFRKGYWVANPTSLTPLEQEILAGLKEEQTCSK